MNRIYVFLIQNDVWIYIVSGIGLFWYAGQFLRARRELRQAMFGLERERGLRRQRRSLTVSFLLVTVILIVTYVNILVAPDLPPDLFKPPTPTPNLFSTPLSSPTPFETEEGTDPVLAPTVTLASTLSGGSAGQNGDVLPEPTVSLTPPTAIEACEPEVSITSPPNGTQLSGNLTIFGTASGSEAATYDIEVHGIETDYQWYSLLQSPRPAPVLDGILGSADLTSWESGRYTIRLLVFSQDDVVVGECAIQVDLNPSG